MQFVNEIPPGQKVGLSQAVKAEAQRLGFPLVGITTPDPPPHFPVFESWLGAGRHGEMAYLETERSRQRRAAPRQILPECQSILVVGVRYPAALPPNSSAEARSNPASALQAEMLRPLEDENKLKGRVAAYAWGKDYHDVLPDRLRSLVAFLEARVGWPIPNRWYTDTGPILERDLAQRAGLGWTGKNTCLIHPQQGSYFLLAEILLGIELEPDPPFIPDHCGSCTRCLDACPTACILPDRTLDARACISYLTIELKGAIPVDLRPPMGDWVFGCDVCQQVCPWNERFADPQGDPGLAPRPEVAEPDLIAELALSPEEFNRKFKGSPVKRAKRRGYLRNVAVALGNSGSPAAVPALARALQDEPEPLVRSHAAWALGRIGGEVARRALSEAAVKEAEALVLAEIQAALGE